MDYTALINISTT